LHKNLRELLSQTQFGVPLWYALTVQPKHERISADILDERGFEPFAPFYLDKQPRRAAVVRPLFPRYIFCRFEYDRRADVMKTLGVIDLVKFGPVAEPIPDNEIDAVRLFLESGAEVFPVPYVHVGDRVRIEYGPFYGQSGVVIRERGEARLVVSIPALQRSIAVTLDRDAVALAA
jgi:transcription antitermination factor NusG